MFLFSVSCLPLRRLNLMDRSEVFSQMRGLLELVSADVARIAPFVVVHLRDVAEEPVSEREAFVAPLALVRLALLVHPHHVLVEVAALVEALPTLLASERLRRSGGRRR